MREIDGEKLLRRTLGDNETYPNALKTGIAIGDLLSKFKARLLGLRRYFGALPRGLGHSHKSPR